jgi:probable HAF family extracellular repeat protein
MPRRSRARALVAIATSVVVLAMSSAGATSATFTAVAPVIPGGLILGADLNDAGVMAATADVDAGLVHAVRRAADGTFTDLGFLPGGNSSFATAINSSGAIAGASRTSMSGDYQGFVWTSGGGMVGLGVLNPGETTSSVADINDQGWIVGSSPESASAWVRDPADGVLVAVDPIPTATIMQMDAINDAGTAIGEAFVPGEVVGFTWTEAGGTVALPVPPGETGFRPSAINASGVVVGTTFDLVDGYRTWVWDATNGFRELVGPTGYPSAFGASVNDRGDVAGFVEDGGGNRSLAVWDTARLETTATVFPSPVAGSIDASIEVVTDAGALLVRTNEIVDDDDFERTLLGDLSLVPDPATQVFRDDCGGPVDLGWTAPVFDGYGPVSYDIYRDGALIATVTTTSFSDTPHAATVAYSVVARTPGGAATAAPVSGGSVCLPPSTTTTSIPRLPVADPVVVSPRFTG